MRITKIDDEYIVFDNGWTLRSNHYSDCCEWHWLDFSILTQYNIGVKTHDDIPITERDFNFSNGVTFKGVENEGIILYDIHGNGFFIPGYGENNGYYSTNLDLEYVSPKGIVKFIYNVEECQDIRE